MKTQGTRLNLALALMLISAAHASSTWTSQFLEPDGKGGYASRPVNFDNQQWYLDDHADDGYKRNAVPLGQVPHNIVAIGHGGDITDDLQNAVNKVGRAGGGAVILPGGDITVKNSIAISYSNVEILGSTSRRTVIHVPNSYRTVNNDGFEGLFSFKAHLGDLNREWIHRPASVLGTVSSPVKRGDAQIAVRDASGLHAGDLIVIQQKYWLALVIANSGKPAGNPSNTPDWPLNDDEFAFTYLRNVTGLKGNTVTLDAALPWHLEPQNNPIEIWRAPAGMLHNQGLAHVDITFADLPSSTGGAAVYFESMTDGFAYDVNVVNFPRYGIYVRASARVSLFRVAIRKAQRFGGGGEGYGVEVSESQNVLLKDVSVDTTRHGLVVSRSLSSSVTITQSGTSNETEPSDCHYAGSHGILWDDFQLAKAGLECLNRGNYSGPPGAYFTAFSVILYNVRGDGSPGSIPEGGGAIDITPSPSGWSIVIGGPSQELVRDGTVGNAFLNGRWGNFLPGMHMGPMPGFQVGSGPHSLKNVLYEGLYQPGLQPSSLFEVQRAHRGLPATSFQEPSGSAATFIDGFEAPTLNNFWSVIQQNGRALLTTGTSLVHSGKQALLLLPQYCVVDGIGTGAERQESGSSVGSTSCNPGHMLIALRHTFTAPLKGSASIYWLNKAQDAPVESFNHALSVYDSSRPDMRATISSGRVSFSGKQPSVQPSLAFGYHKLTITYAPAQVTFLIDDKTVYAVPGDYAFDVIDISTDGIFTVESEAGYYDDFSFLPTG